MSCNQLILRGSYLGYHKRIWYTTNIMKKPNLNILLALTLGSWAAVVIATFGLKALCADTAVGCGPNMLFALVPGVAMWVLTLLYLIHIMHRYKIGEKLPLIHKIGFYVVLLLACIPGAGPLWMLVNLLVNPF
jgi:hypothetical protein